MNATVIDTLRFADRLKAAGFEAPHAEGLARALGSELAERIVTKSDLDGALRPIYARFDAIDASFDAMAGSSDARFDAVDARFDAMAGSTDARFDAMAGNTDARFDAVDARFDAADARFDALDEKIDSVHRELSGKFNILLGVMALGFTLLTGLGGYNAISPHYAKPIMAVPEAHEQASELRVAPSSPLPAGD
ncbi:MAG: hypothetical protein OXP28_01555 [Gammaproteobacteria bacterium]|nr:hypothetical protein [Gammaproteobacteria bacterium]